MKKLLVIVSLLMVISLLVGCQQAVENKLEQDIKTETGMDVDVDIKTGGTGWCSAGSSWAASGDQGSANMVVVGLVSSGKYDGFCHVKYDVDTGDGSANMDFYFNEDGSAGYQVMEVNGQTIESAWND